MTAALTSWLALTLAFGTVALFAVWSRKPTGYRAASVAAFILAAAVSLPATLLPLGGCAPWKPANGDYTVYGGRIDVDVAIYVLLAQGREAPRCYTLPYSTGEANDLQDAQDAEGGPMTLRIGDNGGQFDRTPPVTDSEEKRVETPEFEVM